MADTLSQPHQLARVLKEDVWYPAHPPRTETPEYIWVAQDLIKDDFKYIS